MDDDRRWIAENAPLLLEWAFLTHLELGRGAVVVQGPLDLPFAALCEAGQVAFMTGPELPCEAPTINQLIQEYDPGREALLIVFRKGSAPAHFYGISLHRSVEVEHDRAAMAWLN